MCSNLAGGERHSPCGRVSTSWAKGHAEGLDYHVNVPEYVPDRIGIQRVARHLIEACILDWYDCGRTRQGPNAVADQEYRSCRWEEVVRIPEEGGVRDHQRRQSCVPEGGVVTRARLRQDPSIEGQEKRLSWQTLVLAEAL
jgi:hypothetical protein